MYIITDNNIVKGDEHVCDRAVMFVIVHVSDLCSFRILSDKSCPPLHCWPNSFDFMFVLVNVSHLFIYYMFRSSDVVHISFCLLTISAAIKHCSVSEQKATFS